MTTAERIQRFLDLAAQSIANAERDTAICGREFHLTIARSCLSAARDLVADAVALERVGHGATTLREA